MSKADDFCRLAASFNKKFNNARSSLEHAYRIDSIVVAIEGALMEKPSPTATEQIVLAVEAMEREVNNGGFQQFFLKLHKRICSGLSGRFATNRCPQSGCDC